MCLNEILVLWNKVSNGHSIYRLEIALSFHSFNSSCTNFWCQSNFLSADLIFKWITFLLLYLTRSCVIYFCPIQHFSPGLFLCDKWLEICWIFLSSLFLPTYTSVLPHRTGCWDLHFILYLSCLSYIPVCTLLKNVGWGKLGSSLKWLECIPHWK